MARSAAKKTSAASAPAPQARTKEEKLNSLRKAMKQMNAKGGEGTVMMMSDTRGEQVETFSSGALALDLAMGGGWPRGRIVEVYGPEASGKTTLALHAIAEVQKAGGLAAFVDVEHALDMDYAKNIGVNSESLALAQPGTAEEALDRIEAFVLSGGLDLVVLDSVAALVPEEELEKTMGQATMGIVARLMSKAMRKLTPAASKTGCAIMFVNQLRANIGGYGPSEVPTGGNALKYYSSMRVEIRAPKGNIIWGPGKVAGGQPTGVTAKATVSKNKCAPPHRRAEFEIRFGKGISQVDNLFSVALDTGLIMQKGAWYQYEEVSLQGRQTWVERLTEDADLCKKLEVLVRERISLHPRAAEDGSLATEAGDVF